MVSSLVVLTLVVGGLLLWQANPQITKMHSTAPTSASSDPTAVPPANQLASLSSYTPDDTVPLTLATPPPSCHYCDGNLVGKTAAQVAEHALQYVQKRGIAHNGTPKILLVRSITREEYTGLGLGCLGEPITIEEAPLALVIMKGEINPDVFDYAHMPFLAAVMYLGLVFDLWTGNHTAAIGEANGSIFRKALNDPSVHMPTEKPTTDCPQGKPVGERTLHYWDPAPGFTDPSQAPLPWPVRSPLPTPTHEVAPEPLPTQEGPVGIPAPGATHDAMPIQAQPVK